MILCTLVPTPLAKVKFLTDQLVGQPLTLECSITTVRGITSRVDVVWSSNGVELKRIEQPRINTSSDNSVLYTEYYTTSQLITADEGRVFECNVFINSILPVVLMDNVTINVTGE